MYISTLSPSHITVFFNLVNIRKYESLNRAPENAG